MRVAVEPSYDPRTSTWTWIAADPASGDAVVIDPVLDFEPATGRVWTESLDGVLARVQALGWRVRGVLETHVHADHLTGAHALRARLGVPIAIGSRIVEVQARFAPVFGLTPAHGGGDFDRVAGDGDRLAFGTLRATARHTPGHTPACVTWQLAVGEEPADAVFTGDALFLPDVGVGRCDFPDGSAASLYDSVHGGLYGLPDDTRVFVGHDYPPVGRGPQGQTTIGSSRAENVQLPASRSREDFVAARTARDATLAPPRLLPFALQVNLVAGRLPAPDAGGRRLLHLPIYAESDAGS